jgi:hypothetical protein
MSKVVVVMLIYHRHKPVDLTMDSYRLIYLLCHVMSASVLHLEPNFKITIN